MKKLSLLSLVVLTLTAASWPQVSSEPANSQGQVAASPAQNSTAPDTLPPGTVLLVELSGRLDAKKCQANDKIEARTVTDVPIPGQAAIRRNAKIVGHITEAKAHSKTSPGSMVGIAFDRIVLKDGREVPLQVMVQAIARPLHVPPLESGPDVLAGVNAPHHGLPPVGSQATTGDSSSTTLTSNTYPSNVPAPPSTNTGGPTNPMVGPLDSSSRGVFGIRDLYLDNSGTASVLSSSTGNLHLDGGTQMTLRVQ